MTLPRIRPCNADSQGNPTTRITVMVTRTTSDRRFFLKPSETVNNVIGYCVFAAAEKYGADIHSISALSNHIHTGLTIDPDKLSDFNADVHRGIAQCLIAHYRELYPKRTLEALWSTTPTHELLLANQDAILKETVYMLANPEAACLVADYKKWPGLRSTPRDWVRLKEHCTTYKRPTLYFSKAGRAPAEVTARYTIPPAFAHWQPMEFVQTIEALYNTEHRRLHSENAGKKYLGAKAALAVNPFDAPSSPRPRGNAVPTVACGGDRALMTVAKQAELAFRRTYRAAWREFKELGSAIFPAGCLKMRTHFHMPCAEGCFDWCLLNPG